MKHFTKYCLFLALFFIATQLVACGASGVDVVFPPDAPAQSQEGNDQESAEAEAAEAGTAVDESPEAASLPEVTVTPDEEGDGTTAVIDDGSTITEFSVDLADGVKIPDGYPAKLFPLYPNGTVTMAASQGNTYTIVIATDDSTDDIYAFYEKELQFDVLELSQKASGFMMISGMVDGLYASVMTTQNFSEAGGANLITLAISPEN